MSESDSTVMYRRVPSGFSRRTLRDFALTLQDSVGDGRRFHCLITGDCELRNLNRTFLGKDYPTDVLSFPQQDVDGFVGEIAISVQRAAAQAPEFGHSLATEIQILMLHGYLHLLGMDHETDRGRMARTERKWRKQLGLPTGLIERARS